MQLWDNKTYYSKISKSEYEVKERKKISQRHDKVNRTFMKIGQMKVKQKIVLEKYFFFCF